MKILYPFTVKREGAKFLVEFLDLEEAFTEGDSMPQAIFAAAEVLSLVLTQRMEDDVEIPAPSRPKKVRGAMMFAVAPDASVQAALLTHLLRKAKKMSTADVARALDTSWPAAQRLEDPRHATSLKQLERAAAAMGHRLVISFEEVGSEAAA